MPNNPVQIILNDRDFHRAPDPGQPPWPKDFFVDADRAFVAHRNGLAQSVEDIIETVTGSPFGPATYLKVKMRTEALAKSYRPVQELFKNDQFPCVGAEAVGTLYFRAPLIYLSRLKMRILEAEDSVRIAIRRRSGEPYPSPTWKRGEVGAIETIEIAPPSGKRDFSTAAAIQMLSDPQTASGYQIDLFESLDDDVIANDPTGRVDLFLSLEELLLSFGPGAQTFLTSRMGRLPILEFHLTRSETQATFENRLGIVRGDEKLASDVAITDHNPERHEAALNKLQAHPLVRAIRPPIQLQLADLGGSTGDQPAAVGMQIEIPEPVQGATYPKVGIIDSGIADILHPWVIDQFDYLSAGDYDSQHGTRVAGLISLGQRINAPQIVPEADGCTLYDIPLYPRGGFRSQFKNGFWDFLGEVEQAVAEARENHDVRIFNLSINAIEAVDRYNYSVYAAALDRISDTYDVVFVNSAGNLGAAELRTSWGEKPNDVIGYFAVRTAPDTIFKPAESVRSVSVGALNPPNDNPAHLADVPTTYTRRGPGLQVGVKPDVAAYGGAGVTQPGASTGLASVDTQGTATPVVGTSFAAPLVARKLAGLDAATSGSLHVEALRAILFHNAEIPAPLKSPRLKALARQFVGFGSPTPVREMLETDDHEITLLFQSRLRINPGQGKPAILRFPFVWPQSLVDGGKCSGRARMTLVYAPPLDPAFGAEFVRVNLEARLKQRQVTPDAEGNPRFENQIKPKYMPKSAGLAIPERALINHGLKWWPAKQYFKAYTGHGEFSEWRLEVTSLNRAETAFPAEGVPFAVLLTIDDPLGRAPVFTEMHQTLQASAATIQSLQTELRIRPRG